MSHNFWRAVAPLFVALLAFGLLMVILPGPVLAEPPVAGNQQAEPGVCQAYPIIIPASSFSGGISQGQQISIPFLTIAPAPGEFSFLAWNNSAAGSSQALIDSLLHPERVATDFDEPDSFPPDTTLNVEDWIQAAGVPMSTNVQSALNSLIGTEMLMPVWNDSDCITVGGGWECSGAVSQGVTTKYQTATFVSMKLLEVHSVGSPKGLTFQFNYFTSGNQFTPCTSNGNELLPVGNLDTVLVLDTTGSMRYDTICWGCWARCGDTANYEGNNGWLIPSGICSADDRYKEYPENGWAFPYDYNGATMLNLANGNNGLPQPEDRNGDGDWLDSDEDFIMIEAEFYADNTSSWDPAFRAPGTGYWAIQRNWETKAYSVDGYGYGGNFNDKELSGAVRHHPFLETYDGINPLGKFYTLEEAQNGLAPRLEYDFMPRWGGNTYIYVRALGMSNTNGGDKTIYWTIANSSGTNLQSVSAKTGGGDNGWDRPLYGCSDTNCGGGVYNESKTRWQWVKLSSGGNALTSGQLYKLRIWAGQPGYALDRILITSRNLSESDLNDPYLGSSNSVRLLREAPTTAGSAQGLAADPCNPIFGLSVLPSDCTSMILYGPKNNLNDALFDAMQPMRGAQESIRAFIARLDPKLDQAGFVDFSSDARQDSQLECLRAARSRAAIFPPGPINDYPLKASVYGEYDELTCFDKNLVVSGQKPISYTNDFIAIEDTYPPSGDTDIADGLRRGLHLLGINTDNDDDAAHANDCAWNSNDIWWRLPRLDGSWLNQPGPDSKSNPVVAHCGRGQAATGIIVLLTDGTPTNSNPGDDANCFASPTEPLPYPGFPDSDKKYRCIIYYADIAAANNVPICTIGLGSSVDASLLEAIAGRSGGRAYFAASYAALDMTAVINDCLQPLGADLAVQANKPSQVVEAGQSISYTLAISNIGPVKTVSTTLVNTWTPTGAVTAAAAPGCAVNVAGGAITCTTAGLGLLSPLSQPVTLTLRANFSGTLTSQAEITSTAGLPDNRPDNNHTSIHLINLIPYYFPIIFKEAN